MKTYPSICRGLAKQQRMDACILAIDCGTTGLKSTLVARNGRTLATVVHDYRNQTRNQPGGEAEQQPEDWWHAMCSCVNELLAKNDASKIAAVSLSGQMQDVILVRKDGDVLGPAILYSDSRAVEQASAIEARFGKDYLSLETGNWKGSLSILPKLMWIHEHRTGTFQECTMVCNGI